MIQLGSIHFGKHFPLRDEIPHFSVDPFDPPARLGSDVVYRECLNSGSKDIRLRDILHPGGLDRHQRDFDGIRRHPVRTGAIVLPIAATAEHRQDDADEKQDPENRFHILQSILSVYQIHIAAVIQEIVAQRLLQLRFRNHKVVDRLTDRQLGLRQS